MNDISINYYTYLVLKHAKLFVNFLRLVCSPYHSVLMCENNLRMTIGFCGVQKLSLSLFNGIHSKSYTTVDSMTFYQFRVCLLLLRMYSK